MTASSGPVVRVHVVIPARDEAARIGRCLRSVRSALDRLQREHGVDAAVTVVADACTDDTSAIAVAHGARVVSVDERCVGHARDAGVRRALGPGVDPASVWVATTDADSVVPPSWLVDQLASFARGTELWLGPVHPDPTSVSTRVLGEWQARHPGATDAAGVSIHGASLGFTGALYLAVGGFPHLAEHEDVGLVRAAIGGGARWEVGEVPVVTSGRTSGRTPGGFAGYLRMLVAELEVERAE